MKKCTKCKITKTLDEFSNKKASKTGKSTICLECTREYTRNHYKNNKAYYRKKAKKFNFNFRKWFQEFKSNLFCSKCGEDRWWVLDFHHRDPTQKQSNVSSIVNLSSKTKLLKEVEKCDVLCSNCHRDLHYHLKNSE